MGLRAEGAGGWAPGAAGGGGSPGGEERLEHSISMPRPLWMSYWISSPPFSLNVSPAEKPGLTERKGGLGVPSRDRNVGAPGQDSPGVSLQPVSGDSPDREPGESPGPHDKSTPQFSPHVPPCSRPAPGHQCHS